MAKRSKPRIQGRLAHSAELLALVKMPDEETQEKQRVTGRAVSLEFRGRTEILHVRPGLWNVWRVMLGVWLFRWAQKLTGLKIGHGHLVIQPHGDTPGRTIEL